MEASFRHQGFIQKTFQTLKNVPKPWVFARFLPRMTDSSKTFKNHWFLIHFHPKPSKTLGKHSFFQRKLRPGTKASFISKTFQNLGDFKIFRKNVPKPLVFARFLPRMTDSSKTFKNQWFLIHVHPKP